MKHPRFLTAGRIKNFFFTLGSILLIMASDPSIAGMTWQARAVDPALISSLKSDNKLLEETLFGVPPQAFTDKLKKDGHFDFSTNREIVDEVKAWSLKRKAEVGDTEIDIDKAWHGIHYLLTGSAESNESLASKVIMGGEDIGPDRGYGPAQLLKPDEVKDIARLLDATTPDALRKRFKPKEMTDAKVYPDIWVRDGDEALSYVLDYYKKLAAFYKRAAERGQAVIFAIS